MTAPEYIFIYTGRHYGCRHLVLSRDERHNTITAIHEATGHIITAHACDCDPA